MVNRIVFLGLLSGGVYWTLCCAAVAGGSGLVPEAMLANTPTWLSGLFAVGLFAAAAYLFNRQRTRGFKLGDGVVYLMPKHRAQPCPRAENIRASQGGDTYAYIVRKPWTVVRELDEDRVEVITRRGKHRVLKVDDPLLRRAGLWESLVMRFRWNKTFPAVS